MGAWAVPPVPGQGKAEPRPLPFITAAELTGLLGLGSWQGRESQAGVGPGSRGPCQQVDFGGWVSRGRSGRRMAAALVKGPMSWAAIG